jgi:hypothetical protein
MSRIPWTFPPPRKAYSSADLVAASREYLLFVIALIVGAIGFLAGWLIAPWVWV